MDFPSSARMLRFGAALSTPPVVTTLTEQLPKYVRSGVVATVYAFAIAVFGGTTSLVLTALIRRTGDQMVPAYYWTGM